MEIIRHKVREIITVRVEPGQCLMGTIESAMKEIGGNAIVVSGVGSLSKAFLANPGSLDRQQVMRMIKRKELDGPLEIVSLVGAVGPAHAHEDRMSHIHIALSRHDGPDTGGILMYGSEAWFPVEVYLLTYE